MYKEFEETFTNELRWRNEITNSTNDLLDDLVESEKESISYTQEELDLVWNTFDELYGKKSVRYLMAYLIFYLGYSYRDAAHVLDISVAWSHDLLANAIKTVRKKILNEHTIKGVSE